MKLIILMTSLIISSNSLSIEGESLYIEKECYSCHGPSGKSPINPAIPRLDGQKSVYLQKHTTAIVSGTRSSVHSNLMKENVPSLTAEEVKAISEYLSKI